jgi:hypothetical protein
MKFSCGCLGDRVNFRPEVHRRGTGCGDAAASVTEARTARTAVDMARENPGMTTTKCDSCGAEVDAPRNPSKSRMITTPCDCGAEVEFLYDDEGNPIEGRMANGTA